VLVFVLAACGGGGSSGPDSSVMQDAQTADVGNYDFGCAGGAACSLDMVCCATPGATTTFACAAPASCPMADQILCDAPDDCGGSTPVCCGAYVANGTGTYPECGIATLGTSCTTKAACPTHIGNSCTDTTKVQLCQAKADCTDATNNQCCTFESGAASLTFCIDSTTAALGGGTCH
jgi:hypothetical protein